MDFDIQGARRAGYTEGEIADHLAGLRNFDAGAARQAGYSDSAIVQHLMQQSPRMAEARRANSGVGGYIDSLARQFAQGATFGGMDEVSAALNTGAGAWGNYGEALAGERARDRAFQQDNPIASAVANIAGAVASPVSRVGMIARAPEGAGLLARALRGAFSRGAVAGGVGGAAAGFGEGEGGVAERLGSAGQGAATGAVLGGALSAGVSAAAPVAGRVLDYAGLRNPNVAADRQILRAVERDAAGQGRGTADLLAEARPITAEGQALVDRIGGRNVQQLAGVAANTPGAAMEAADRLVQARRGARPERIAGAVDDTLGGGGGTRLMDEEAALRTQRSTAARPLYDEAMAAQAPDTPELRRIMSLPIVQQALTGNFRNQRMQAVARNEAFEPNAMRLLDAAKRGLDARIGETLDPVTRRVIPGQGDTNIALTELRDALVRELDAVPAYAQARAAWAGPTASMEAMGQGAQALRANPDVLARTVERMSPSDRDFFRLGVGRAITDLSNDPARAATAARRLLEDRAMQRRLEAAIPDAAQRQAFADAMRREVEMAAVERVISPRAGSQTARLQAGMDDMGRDPPGGALASLLMGRPMEGARMAWGSMYRATQGINSKTADALASRLLDPNPEVQAQTLADLLRRRQADQISAARNNVLAQQLLRGLGAGATLSTGN